MLNSNEATRRSGRAVWVGRLETPKDPILAIDAFAALGDNASEAELVLIGDGSLRAKVEAHIAGLPDSVSRRMVVRGRLTATQVAEEVGRSDVFLMTSHTGYEGYPRVLVEAMAAGTIPVVTVGSDTGGLVTEGITGYLTSRNPTDIARKVIDASANIKRSHVMAAVADLSAPAVIAAIYAETTA